MMKSEDTASFLLSLAKRGRKYYLGLATITQDVEDFLKSPYGTPIINPGESAILGLGRIFDRVVLDSSGKVKNVKILPISLTFDHQIIDGAEANMFIETLKEYLESPEHLLEK